MNRALNITLGIVVLVIVAGGSFYGGMVYGQGQAQARFAARRQVFFSQGGQFPGPGQGTVQPPGGMLFGQIEQIGDDALTIKDNNGKQTQVHVTDTTLIEKNMSVSLADLAPGETVIVSGSQESDGSITARSVRVAPAGRFGPGGPGATPAP